MKWSHHVTLWIAVVAVTASVTAGSAFAQEPGRADSPRKGKWEMMLAPQYALAKTLGFEGGTTAKIDDTVGFGFQFGYNFNAHWNLGGLFSWSRPDYQAVMQPVAGNPSAPRATSGTVETTNFALVATYYFLTGPITPYAAANLGGTFINTDIADGPPVVGCYYDPWYGNFCGPVQPTKSNTFLSYGVGGGLRWDVTRTFFMRADVRQQWVDLSYTGTPGFTIFKLDFGLMF